MAKTKWVTVAHIHLVESSCDPYEVHTDKKGDYIFVEVDRDYQTDEPELKKVYLSKRFPKNTDKVIAVLDAGEE